MVFYNLYISPKDFYQSPPKTFIDRKKNFLLLNGDVLTDLNFEKFYSQHIKNKTIFSIASNLREENIDYGVLEVDNESCLKQFKEKPKVNYQVSMGVYMNNKEILNFIPDDTYYGFDNLMLFLLKEN